jgi:hypothetical protein
MNPVTTPLRVRSIYVITPFHKVSFLLLTSKEIQSTLTRLKHENWLYTENIIEITKNVLLLYPETLSL